MSFCTFSVTTRFRACLVRDIFDISFQILCIKGWFCPFNRRISTLFFLLQQQYLQEIEEHLGETITTVESDMKIPINEFDGKVTYGKRRKKESK